jgi:hypothetical protein
MLSTPHRVKARVDAQFLGRNNEPNTDQPCGRRQPVCGSRIARASGIGRVAGALRLRHAAGAYLSQSALLGYLYRWRVEDGVPWFNFDRAQTVTSIERIKKIAANLKATVMIHHDARDVEELPVFPAFAK